MLILLLNLYSQNSMNKILLLPFQVRKLKSEQILLKITRQKQNLTLKFVLLSRPPSMDYIKGIFVNKHFLLLSLVLSIESILVCLAHISCHIKNEYITFCVKYTSIKKYAQISMSLMIALYGIPSSLFTKQPSDGNLMFTVYCLYQMGNV